jgi:ferredoxin-nitrite reductase
MIVKMEELKKILLSEIDQFNELGHKFLNGEVNKSDFKKASGGMGVYAHRDGKKFMIRFRIPCGITSKEELFKVYNFVKEYNLDGVHLTTRQAIQLHGLSIDHVCKIMKEALEADIYTRGGGGNFPRNVAISPLSGVDPNEVFDITPYALQVNNYFLKKIHTYKLPRKLKVSFSSSNTDNAHCTVTDIGFLAIRQDGKEYFKIYLGGGLGRNPATSVEFDELVELKDVLYHIEAITNLFINEGDYENKSKARIRFIVERMGKDEFIDCYKKYLGDVKIKNDLDIDITSKVYSKQGIETNISHSRLFKQKQLGLYSVYFHPIGGQLKIQDFKLILNELDKITDPEIRLTMTEGLFIRNLNGREAEGILEVTQNIGGETRLEQSVACIGVPTCQMGCLNGQSTLREIIKVFRENNLKRDILPRIHISGCQNSCGVHEIGEIGFTGKKKRIDEEVKNVFELHIGGSFVAENTRLGKHYGDILQQEVPQFLYELAKLVEESHMKFCKWPTENEEELLGLIKKYQV